MHKCAWRTACFYCTVEEPAKSKRICETDLNTPLTSPWHTPDACESSQLTGDEHPKPFMLSNCLVLHIWSTR